ncbi:tom1 protein 2 [Echinococcus multilocularis]|uniref:Tom1 protein 2 n=1 Tax=Echinococcus multilocularis TaxID=6211 RepID=A0A087VYD3_ECHMU|nr:tom1 protein 2 [Echinococcus multilocularis]
MQNLFQSHPYSTRVGTLIERVTDSGKLAIDWTIVLEICDALGETDEGPKEAIRAIRKRLTSSAGKDHISIWYTLILIEACLKNCGRRFQAQVANRDFLHDLIKVLLPKHNPPIQLQTKILFLIKSWVDASWDVPGRRDLEKVYTALRRKGVQFPTPIECKTLPPPQQSSTMKRPVSSSATSRSTKLASTFRRLTSGALGGGGDCRFKTHLSSLSQNRADDSRRCHYHQQQSSSTSHLQRVGTSESPVTNRARESGRQIRIRNGGGSGIGGIEPGAQVLQVVAINGYPVVTRSGQEVFFATAPRTFLNHHHHHHQQQQQQQQQHRYQHQQYESSQQLQQASSTTHHSMPSGMYSLSGDQTLVDHEGTVRRLSTAQRERLSQDLTVVQTNLHILNDMLTELQPDAISPDDLELLQELNETCRMMQQRVAEFLSQVADDAVTLTLIQLNDELNSAFQRYERFERYRLRALRAQIANRDVGQSRAALPSTEMVSSQQLQLEPLMTQPHQQQLQQRHHINLSLPSTAGMLPHSKDEYEGGGGDNEEDEDDDDDELLDAVAEQTQRNPPTTELGDSELVSVGDWSDNALALQALRLNDTSHTSWNTDSSAAQLDRVFGEGYNSPISHPTGTQTAMSTVQVLPGPQLEPLQPQPAPLPTPPAPPPPPPPSLKALPQPPIKKRTPSEVRRLEEALLLFES